MLSQEIKKLHARRRPGFFVAISRAARKIEPGEKEING